VLRRRIGFDGYQPLTVNSGAKESGVEVSYSETYNMAGWRVGFVVGNRHIQGLQTLKTNLDYGIFWRCKQQLRDGMQPGCLFG